MSRDGAPECHWPSEPNPDLQAKGKTMKKFVSLLIVPLALGIAACLGFGLEPLNAGGRRAAHGACCERCGTSCETCQLVECTVMVPAIVIQKRLKPCVVQHTEMREETYTVFKRVPVKRTYTKEECYLDTEVRTKTIEEKKCHRVMNPAVGVFTVKALHKEIRMETVKKEVCTDCGDKVCVEEQVPCEVYVEHEEVQSKNCCEPDIVIAKTKRDISYCVQVPKKKKKTCEETTYKLVPVEKKRKVEVCIPKIVKKPYEVRVKKMIPKKILCCTRCRHGH